MGIPASPNGKVKGMKCWYCGDPAYNIDHRIPQSRMRGVGPGNKVPACLICNSTKANLSVEEFRVYLKTHAANPISSCRPKLAHIILRVKPHGFVFFGERHWAKDFDTALARLEEKHREITDFIGTNKAWRGWLKEAKHILETPQKAYWHAGYMACLADVLEMLGSGLTPRRMNWIQVGDKEARS